MTFNLSFRAAVELLKFLMKDDVHFMHSEMVHSVTNMIELLQKGNSDRGDLADFISYCMKGDDYDAHFDLIGRNSKFNKLVSRFYGKAITSPGYYIKLNFPIVIPREFYGHSFESVTHKGVVGRYDDHWYLFLTHTNQYEIKSIAQSSSYLQKYVLPAISEARKAETSYVISVNIPTIKCQKTISMETLGEWSDRRGLQLDVSCIAGFQCNFPIERKNTGLGLKDCDKKIEFGSSEMLIMKLGEQLNIRFMIYAASD